MKTVSCRIIVFLLSGIFLSCAHSPTARQSQYKTKTEALTQFFLMKESGFPLQYQEIKTKFTDDFRIDFVIKHDTLLTYYTDLKLNEGPIFDESFKVISTFKSFQTEIIHSKHVIKYNLDSILLTFRINDIIRAYLYDLSHYAFTFEPDFYRNAPVFPVSIFPKDPMRTYYNYFAFKKESPLIPLTIFILLERCPFEAYNLVEDCSTDRLTVENYITDFSTGKQFYFITSENDTAMFSVPISFY